ncbi:MAG: metallophosphoesterase [Alphaproteobacteria bacterium]|nr:metallophosphoesterase [Alphaproteobacteria bacterium]MCB9698564.1 metallophosphoesterase [Alphaproteobacteria bacterium]
MSGWLAPLLLGCVAPGMKQLHVRAAPSDAQVRCTTEPDRQLPLCSEEQRAWEQTWREVEGTRGERLRLVVTGDAGMRDGDRPSPGALAVATSAKAVCRGTCDGVLFLGDDVYWTGIDEGAAGDDGRQFLRALLDAYAMPHAWFTPGNHDWGPSWLMYGAAPSRDRVQRLFEALREDDARGDRMRGDAHFWQATMGPLEVAALDTTWLVRRCHGADVSCKGDAEGTKMREALGTMVGSADVVVGHHPWHSNGGHGSAGRYRDVRPFSQGKGTALAATLERLGPELYLAGHDHGTQVHLDPKGHLSLVLGAGSKAEPPSRHPREELLYEDWCRLGFAVVEAEGDDLAVQVYTLDEPDTKASSEERRSCRDVLADRVGPVTTLPGEHVREALPGTDLRCARFALRSGGWTREQGCHALLPPPPAPPPAPGPLGIPAIP